MPNSIRNTPSPNDDGTQLPTARQRSSTQHIRSTLLLIASVVALPSMDSFAQEPFDVSETLRRTVVQGPLRDGQDKLADQLSKNPGEDRLRFALGIVQFLQSIERLTQTLYQFGAEPKDALVTMIPFTRLPVPANPEPKEVTYEELRTMLRTFLDDIALVKKTLEPITDRSIKIDFPIGTAALDINRNGKFDADDSLMHIYFATVLRNQTPRNISDNAEKLVASMDYSDVLWLRGYCHLLTAMGNGLLMYDHQDCFNHLSKFLFKKPKPSVPDPTQDRGGFDFYFDLIAACHLMVFPVREPNRGLTIIEELKAVTELSRQTWDAIEAETDDDREWIPGAHQRCFLPQLQVTQTMASTWRSFLKDADAILDGKVLVPHARIPNKGINMNRFFTEPRAFDLILWVHGVAAGPYLETGTTMSQTDWNQLQNVFQGRFIGFAAWFN